MVNRNLKTNIAIKCDSIEQLKECRKRLIEMGYEDDKEWNDKRERDPYLYVMIFANGEFSFHTHNGNMYEIPTFNEFFSIPQQPKIKLSFQSYIIIAIAIALLFTIGMCINSMQRIAELENYVYPVRFIYEQLPQ